MILALASREPMKRRPGVRTRRPNQAGVPDEPAARVSAPRVRRHWPAPPSPSTLAAEECAHDAEGRSENGRAASAAHDADSALTPAARTPGLRRAGPLAAGVRRGGDPRLPAPSTSALRPGRQPKASSGCSNPAGCTERHTSSLRVTESEASADGRDVEAKRFADGNEGERPAGVIRGEPRLYLGELAASPTIGPGRVRLVLAEGTIKDRDHETPHGEQRIGLRLKTELLWQDRRLGRYGDGRLEASHGVGRMARPRERREPPTLLCPFASPVRAASVRATTTVSASRPPRRAGTARRGRQRPARRTQQPSPPSGPRRRAGRSAPSLRLQRHSRSWCPP